MVNYYVISKNEKAVGQGGETLYGVCACTLHDGVMEVQNCIYGISGDLAWLKTLRGKLNDGEVDPVHLGDIIADELYMRDCDLSSGKDLFLCVWQFVMTMSWNGESCTACLKNTFPKHPSAANSPYMTTEQHFTMILWMEWSLISSSSTCSWRIPLA